MGGLIPGLATTQGWLPYGSTDASVVLQHPLTSMPVTGPLMPYSSIALGTSSVGNPVFDPVKGVLFSDNDFAQTFRTGLNLTSPTLSTAVLNSLYDHGQMSFEIETPAVVSNSSTYFSSGGDVSNAPGGDTFLFFLKGQDALAIVRQFGQTGIQLYGQPGNTYDTSQGFWLREHLFATSNTPNTGYQNFGSAGALFTAYIDNNSTPGTYSGVAGLVMTVTGVQSGTIQTGQQVYAGGTNICGISSLGTGSGGVGTYNVNVSQAKSPQTMAAGGVGTYGSYRATGSGGPGAQFHSYGKGPFCRINIGWVGGPNGGIVFFAINGGHPVRVWQRGFNNGTFIVTNSWFNQLCIGCTPAANTAPSRYMRNFQVSTAAPTWAVKPNFFNIAILGDSTTPTDGTGLDLTLGNWGDLNTTQVIRQAFGQFGYYVRIFGSNNSGNSIDDSSTPNNSTPTDTTCLLYWKDVINPVGQQNSNYNSRPAGNFPWPDVVVIRGGINDVAGDYIGSSNSYQNPPVILQDSRFLASLDRLVNYTMWGQSTNAVVSSGTRTPVKRMILMTPHSPRWGGSGWGNNPKPAAVAGSLPFAYNYMYNTLLAYPARWNSRYPGYAGLITVADYASFVGGDNYAFSGVPGLGSGAPPNICGDGVHPNNAVAGQYTVGQCLAQALLSAFAQS